jgi:hypothetical protein
MFLRNAQLVPRSSVFLLLAYFIGQGEIANFLLRGSLIKPRVDE